MATKTKYEERMTDNLGLKQLTEESMVCANCKHCEGNILSCAIYSQKPDAVLDGEECTRFETK